MSVTGIAMLKNCWLCLVFTLMLLLTVAGATFAGPGDFEKGMRKYDQYCASCHGKDGQGDGTRVTVERLDPRPRNHTDGNYMNKRTDVELFKVDKGGGYSMNLSHIMPSWEHILSDKEIWDLVAYLRTLAVPPYTPQSGGGSQSKKIN